MIKKIIFLSTEIETPRLQLRQPLKKDLFTLANLWKNKKVRQFLGGIISDKQSLEKMTAIESHWAKYNFGLFTVCDKNSQEVIGVCGLHYSHNDDKKVEVSYMFFPEFWGSGLATEALLASLYYGFNQLKLDKIIAITQESNNRSCQLLERVGMSYIDRFEQFGENQRLYILKKSTWPMLSSNETTLS